MSTFTLILLIVGGFVAVMAIAGVFAYQKFAVPAYKPLSKEDRAICAEIVRQHKGYPWLCTYCVGKGACPCQPCQKIADARSASR